MTENVLNNNQRNMLQTLKNLDNNTLLQTIQFININGIVSDSDTSTFPISRIIEYWSRDCTNYLKENGYKGKDLKLYVIFCEEIGSTWVLYNPDRYYIDDDKLPCPVDYLELKNKKFIDSHQNSIY